MKICQLCAVDFTLSKFLLPLIDEMKKEGWVVEAVCSRGNYTDCLSKKGYVIKNIDIPRKLNPFKIIKAFYSLYKLLKKEKYDVVHTHTPIASIIARLACKIVGVPIVIYTAHGFYFHENMSLIKYYFFVIIEKIAGCYTNILFTQSAEDALLANKYKLLPKDNIFNIGNGVDIKKFDPFNIKNTASIKSNLQIPQTAFVIGCIARLVKEKGLIEFLDAAKNINKKYKDVYFLIIGERLVSDHNSNVEKYILDAKQYLKENIIFLGLRDDIPEMISIMDLFCLPSWREGMPRSIIEAMMMKKPVLATNVRGSREEVINKKTGLIVPIKSSLELRKAMIKIIENRAMGIKFGKEGRKRALMLYNEEIRINSQIIIIKEKIEIYQLK